MFPFSICPGEKPSSHDKERALAAGSGAARRQSMPHRHRRGVPSPPNGLSVVTLGKQLVQAGIVAEFGLRCFGRFVGYGLAAGPVRSALSELPLQLLGFVEKFLRDHRRMPLKVAVRE
jgi:hypothetical protein